MPTRSFVSGDIFSHSFSKYSHIHFPYKARERLIAQGGPSSCFYQIYDIILRPPNNQQQLHKHCKYQPRVKSNKKIPHFRSNPQRQQENKRETQKKDTVDQPPIEATSQWIILVLVIGGTGRDYITP